jgi:predicted Zn-dependent protease
VHDDDRAGAVGVERRQLLLMSSAEMDQSATAAYQNVLKEQGAKGTVNRDQQQVERVRRIAARLTPQTAVFRKDAPGWTWEVNVITSPELNAWCMPGGKIAFYSGMLEKLQMTDDVGAGVVGSALGVGQGGADLVAMVGQVTFLLPYSRLHETEADRMGVELAARAGYDPRAAIALWQKMAKVSSGGGPPQLLSTHPSSDERIKDLGVFAQRVLPLYEQARTK